MKRIILLTVAAWVFMVHISQAQVSINTDASQPDASSMLDIKSSTRGLLVPRLTTVQRTAIATPADGLLVYDTDAKGFWYYSGGTGWIQISNGSGGLTLPYTGTLNSASPLFTIINTGTGLAIQGNSTGGSGVYGSSNTSSGAGLLADNLNGGEAVVGRAASTTMRTGAVVGRNDGAGYGVQGLIATDNSGNAIAVLGQIGTNNSTGVAGHFENTYASNAKATLEAVTNGLGSGATLSNTNSANTSNVLQVTGIGQGVIADHTVGNAGNFVMNNTNGVGAGVRGEVNSQFGNSGTSGVYGVASGTGGYGGYFEHSASSGFGYALYANTQGLGPVTYMENLNAATVANSLIVTSLSQGVITDHSKGNTANFFINNTNGVGAAVRGETNSIFGNEGAAGIYGVGSGTGGYGGYFEHTETTGYGNALSATTQGLGSVAVITNPNPANTNNTLDVSSVGPGVIGSSYQGNAANFLIDNPNGVGAAVRGETNTVFGNYGAAGIHGVGSGTGGYGGFFEHTEATGYGNALYATTLGLGTVAVIENTNAASTNNSLEVRNIGGGVITDHSQGNAANFLINNTNGVGAAVRGETNTIFGNEGAAGIYGVGSGTGGYGGYFEHTETTGYGNALFATTQGLGTVAVITNPNPATTNNTLEVTSVGQGVIGSPSQGNTANFEILNTNGIGAAVRGETNTIFGNNGAAGIYGVSSGTGGYGGFFEHTETTGFGIALQVLSNDKGPAMEVSHYGSGDLAVFTTNAGDVARIDHNGRGFFNGGTQNSGADLAESFAVEGISTNYEPGDVLIISTRADRTLEKSDAAYSTLVAGVYATKPGVLLTDKAVGSDLSTEVPMGVVGVIPTKVCNQNGPIHRGDLLVTSDRPGYAMKADLEKLKAGQVIGKALEEFTSDLGKIKVLVNVK